MALLLSADTQWLAVISPATGDRVAGLADQLFCTTAVDHHRIFADIRCHLCQIVNRSKEVIQAAYNDKAIDGELNEGNIKDCDLILLCLYPQLCIDYLTKMAPYIITYLLRL